LTLKGPRATVAREALMSRIFALALAGLLSIAAAAPAAAASWFELNFGLSGPRYDALVPLCDDRGVLIQIHSKFSHKESEYWASNLEIVDIERIREINFRPWTGAPQAIPRRFCSGVAHTSDGARHAINYSILENSGWLGVGWGVEWCVVGLDRNWAYNPSCRMARP
jgi:hypothetical protein